MSGAGRCGRDVGIRRDGDAEEVVKIRKSKSAAMRSQDVLNKGRPNAISNASIKASHCNPTANNCPLVVAPSQGVENHAIIRMIPEPVNRPIWRAR